MRVDFLRWDKETETFDECDWVLPGDDVISNENAIRIFKEHLKDNQWLKEQATILMINYGTGEYKILTVTPPDGQYEVNVEA